MDKLFNDYLNDINKEYSTGKSTEHTFRPALKKLVESISNKIAATNEPKRIKCGAPDYLITRKKRNLVETIGYIEAKDIGSNLVQTAKTEQIKKRYLPSLNNFILTDYIGFRWYVNAELRETATLAAEQADGTFKATQEGLKQVGDLLQGFISQEPEKITSSKDLAGRLAHMARLLRDLIENTFDKETKTGPLHGQFNAFEKVLLHDLKEDQFADMYAQTICYGLFAARCYIEDVNLFGKDKHAAFHGHDHKGGKFTREHAGWMLPKTNPFLQKMFNEIAGPGLPDEISWLVDDIVALLRNCRMDSVLKGFARQTKRKDPVIHFYETFLAQYDPKLREQRGVYYTPEPVVSYIVRSVDNILKDKFKLKSGLADKSKVKIPVIRQSKKQKTKQVEEFRNIHKLLILDPATGTGTFLYEVIEQIYKRFKKDKGAWSGYVKDHLLPRIHGFELMMAPYTIAHMKIGLQLAEKGYDFKADERLKIFLTNTLEEAEDMSDLPLFTQWLADEARQANEVKRDLPIMVVLGNPPYSGHSANDGKWIKDLVRDYYHCDGEPLGEKNPKWLQDDYVKFIRFSQWRIEQTGYGVLGFITNHGYLDNPTFRGMRQNLMQTFDEIYLLDLHGNSKKKETCPDGSKDVNVFDIQQGVSIGIFVKQTTSKEPAKIYHEDLFGHRKDKYNWLEKKSIKSTDWQEIKPIKPFYLFSPQDTKLLSQYNKYWKITDVMKDNSVGIVTSRDKFVFDIDEDALKRRIKEFLDLKVADEQIKQKYDLSENKSWSVHTSRNKISKEVNNIEDVIYKCLYRPFDEQFLFYNDNVIERSRKEVMQHMLTGENVGLISARSNKSPHMDHFFCSKNIMETKCGESTTQSCLFPLYLYPVDKKGQGVFFGEEKGQGKDGRRANLSDEFIDQLKAKIKLDYIPDGKGDLKNTFGPEDVLAYIYAVLHSPAYRKRYAAFLKIDFPRIPLPDGKVMFSKFAETGFELMSLHLLEADILEDKKHQPVYPVEGGNEVEKGYPSYVADADKPGKGRVHVNKEQYFEGVRPDVWEFHVGGYQVCNKWLKDRRGRTLSYDDIEHYKKITVSLGRTIIIMEQKFLNELWEN
jgi:predicted helicase